MNILRNLVYFTILINSAFTLWIASGNSLTTRPRRHHLSVCLVKNLEFANEYLYSNDELDDQDEYNRRVFTNQIDKKFMTSFGEASWIFQPVESIVRNLTNNSVVYYHIVNLKYQEFLCASYKHFDIFGQRRKVSLMEYVDMDDINCMWALKPLHHQHPNAFQIWNLGWNEAIYAGSGLLKAQKTKRRVFTWYKKPNSKQFNWFIYCFPQRENDDGHQGLNININQKLKR